MLNYGPPHPVIQSVMLGEWRQSSLSTASTYFLHNFVHFSANDSFAHVFIVIHTKSKSYFSDF